MFKWFINLFEKLKSVFRTDTSKMYEGEKPEELVKKVMNDGWNRLGGSDV